uniref:Rho termination factor, N-terminal domain n=1 Tax=Siphoviridae sp. ct3r22 TaxID=2825325 RepID=A0A8S5V0V7_9CAUD|nr:MAG TPA: Rho termination factor, N-terminal domain [Siphoviridae sp. ct3r22]
MAVESLLTLRKKANELGIQNYAKYSKEELAKLNYGSRIIVNTS